jgi:hypothetical protein
MSSRVAWHLLILSIFMTAPLPGLAQTLEKPVDKSRYVQVKKGTTLCPNLKMQQARGTFDPGKVFWRVTSNVRANGTQTIAALREETLYDSKSGDTTVKERQDQEDYATFFIPDLEHEGMLVIVSPQDGKAKASVEVCQKPKRGAPAESLNKKGTD